MTADTETSGSEAEPRRPYPPTRPMTSFNSPAVKFVLIGFVTLMLMVPSTFVWVLVEERADRAQHVARDIARSWGGTQQINGPYLVIPFTETYEAGSEERKVTKVVQRQVVLFPDKLKIQGDLSVEERQKSIYSLPVYQGRVELNGQFSAPPQGAFEPRQGGRIEVSANKARLVLGIGDIKALKSEVHLTIGAGRPIPFEPGLGRLTPNAESGRTLSASGINAQVPAEDWRRGFAFSTSLLVNGSSSFYAAPAGQTTTVTLASDWAHPGFTGAFLPEQRTISNSGFDAVWTIPYLARGIPKMLETGRMPLQDKLLGVKFVEPVNFYQTISRSLKYAIGFVSLTFLAVFVLEMRSGWSFHWIQYGLVGLALIIFYVMLLAFAEHIGYGPAYMVAAPPPHRSTRSISARL